MHFSVAVRIQESAGVGVTVNSFNIGSRNFGAPPQQAPDGVRVEAFQLALVQLDSNPLFLEIAELPLAVKVTVTDDNGHRINAEALLGVILPT